MIDRTEDCEKPFSNEDILTMLRIERHRQKSTTVVWLTIMTFVTFFSFFLAAMSAGKISNLEDRVKVLEEYNK